MGDLLRGKEVGALPEGIRKGVLMHREIDRLTDADPGVKKLNALIAQRHGRYATVLTDIGFDHHLYLRWHEVGPAPLAEFADVAYQRLLSARPHLPPRVVRQTEDMVRGRWLDVYTTEAGMRGVFRRLARRVSRPDQLEGVENLLSDFSEPFNRTFNALYPRLQSFANGFRR